MSRPGAGNRAVFFAAATIPLAIWIAFTFVVAKPYFVVEDDAESPVYYSARLMHEGKPQSYISPPGTPIYEIGSLIMSISGTGPGDTQRFFDIAHFVAALATSFGIAVFCRLCLRDVPFGVAALSVSTVLAWPTVISFIDYFESNSFNVAFGLPTLALFWTTLSDEQEPALWKLALIGAGAGLSLASKMNTLPIALAIFICLCVREVARRSEWKRKWVRILVFCTAMLAIFLIATSSVFGRLPDLLLITLTRDTVLPANGHAISTLRQSAARLLQANPMLILVTAGVIVAALAGRRRSDHNGPTESFDFQTATLLVSLLLAAMTYALMCASPGSDEGLFLKNVAPSALILPFVVLLAFRRSSRADQGADARLVSSATGIVLAAAAVLTVFVSVYGRWETRKSIITAKAESTSALNRRLESLRVPGTRIAYWDDSYDNQFAEISWHLSGNYEYAYERFDAELARRYPAYTLIRLPMVQATYASVIASSLDSSVESGVLPRRGTFGRLGRKWREKFPVPYADRPPGLLSSAVSPASVSLIAFPATQMRRFGDLTEAQFLSLIRREIGVPILRRESIAGIDWILISTTRPEGPS